MKILGNLLISLIVVGIASKNSQIVLANSKENFYVVTSSSGSEKFYLELKRLRADEGRTALHREDLLCSAVINSTFFSRDGNVEMVDTIQEGNIYSQLYPEIDWNVFRRPYKTVNVSVLNEVIEEPVFPCLARERGTGELKLYLISSEYNFNLWIKRKRPTKCPEKFGRFVFEYNKRKQMANLTAIAEEPACRLNYYAEGLGHFFSLKNDLELISTRGHAICNFTIGRKIRICAVGLSAKEYRRDIEFSPYEHNIEPECEKKNLIFRYGGSYKHFSEWVIGCKAKNLGNNNNSTTFYMSIGYEPYQFLIYHPQPEQGTVHLIHHFYTHLGLRNPEYYRDK